MQMPWQAVAFGTESEDSLWELFHENSKLQNLESLSSDEELKRYLALLHESLPFEGFQAIALPKRLPSLKMPLDHAIRSRASVRKMVRRSLRFEQMAALLYFGYGITRDVSVSGLPRSLRVVPSAGAFYPLELFVYATNVKNLSQGLYHYNPVQRHVRLLQDGDCADKLIRLFVPNTLPVHTSLIIFVTAIFERVTLIYGNRGYRFALLEAGHVAQNINLIATSLRLGCLNIGGFVDRQVDKFLHLDGVTHSTVYVIAIGAPANHHRPYQKAYKKGAST